jgi:hypothetical protein
MVWTIVRITKYQFWPASGTPLHVVAATIVVFRDGTTTMN